MDKQQHIQAAVEHGVVAMKAGAAVSISSGIWTWFGENHTQIGAMCAMIGVSIAAMGFMYTVYRDQRDRRDDD